MYPTVQHGSARDVYPASHCTRDARVAQAETRARVADRRGPASGTSCAPRWNPATRVLEESRGELRGRAERAERDLDAARDELTRLRQERAGEG
jgi:hypothetical protein